MKQPNGSEIVGGRYQIEKKIGQGGFGCTYLATDQHYMHAHRAIKCFKSMGSDESAQKALELFEREAKSLLRLTDERVLRTVPSFFAYFHEGNKFYIVQEYINGKNLEEILSEKGAFSEAEVRGIVLSVLETLEVVHGLGIIHRDIKPANLMQKNTDMSIVLVDFGAVKEIFQNSMGKKKPATLIWTEGYAPNEQMNGDPVFSSDIYALGVTAINLLIAKHPNQWRGQSPREMVNLLFGKEYICKEFADILSHMVENDIKNRYEDVKEPVEKLKKLQNTVLVTVLSSKSFNWHKVTEILPYAGFLLIAFLSSWSVVSPLKNSGENGGQPVLPSSPPVITPKPIISSPSPAKTIKTTPASPSNEKTRRENLPTKEKTTREDLPIKFR